MSSLGTALYYPNFHMEPEWGKAALLYWDSLARIVPNAAQSNVDDDDEFSRMLARERVLTSIDTAAYVEETARRFDEYLVPLFEKDPGVKLDAEYVEQLLGSYTSIHPMKLANKLQRDMRDMGVEQEETGYLKVPSQLGGPYMLCLGTVIKDNVGIPLVTDEPSFERLGEYLAFGAPTKAAEDPAKKALFRLGLPMPSAASLRQVPIDKILRFREERVPERQRLKTALDSILKEASAIDDASRFELFWKSKRAEIDASIEDYKRTMRAINLIDFASLFKVSVPTGVATLIAYGGDWLSATTATILTGVAFMVEAGGVLGNRLFRKQSAEQKSPWLYALAVRDKFGPQ
jgi:hypothetical protein